MGVVARVEQQLRAAARDALRHRPDQLAHECLLRARAADRAEDTRRLARGGAGLACIAVGLDVDDELPRDPVAYSFAIVEEWAAAGWEAAALWGCGGRRS